MPDQTILEIKIPRDNESTPEAAATLFAGLAKTLAQPKFFQKLARRSPPAIFLEIACLAQRIHFFAAMDTGFLPYFESQLLAAYPLAVLLTSKDYLAPYRDRAAVAQLVQADAYYYPLKTFRDYEATDTLAPVLAVMSKAAESDFYLVQLALTQAGTGWQTGAQRIIDKGIPQTDGTRQPIPGEALARQKIAENGLRVGLRLAISPKAKLPDLAGGFAHLSRGDGNTLKLKSAGLRANSLRAAIFNRRPTPLPRFQVLTVSELASLWHLPGKNIDIPNIAWGRAILSEAPENLPSGLDATEDQKSQINFFAQTEYKNRLVNFGLKQKDRRRHLYVIGKSGTGKSWLLANMTIDDFKKGHGLAVVDPHGDLCEILLDYIPANRINDVIYFNPADRTHPLALNILEVTQPADAELVTSGIVSIFYKLYAHSWGPRLEHILRNTVMSLANIEGTTLVDILTILTDDRYRAKILAKIDDPVLQSFWQNEFAKMSPQLQAEAISPIQNKVGQFVTSPLVRAIIGRPKSSLSLENIMNEGKILLVNLSQGTLGEDNAALLGAMIITKIQQAAMQRAMIAEEARRDFYLYVDEFQNFATQSFIKILSEARKYRLNLILANQYIAQIEPEVQKAIFGNIGSLTSFVVGADDAGILEKEYGGVFTQSNLVSLDRFQVAVKLTIDAQVTRPFLATTLPLPASRNQNREKVLRVSRERYAYKKTA